MLDAGIVHADIHAAEKLLPERDEFGDSVRLGHVRRRIGGLHPEIVFDGRSLLLDIGRRTHSIEHDVGTCACEGTRICETYTACRTGNDCGQSGATASALHSAIQEPVKSRIFP